MPKFDNSHREKRPFPDEVFWEWLQECGALDADQAEEYRARTKAQPWRPIGRILIEQGILTVNQLMHLLELQAGEPGTLLGALAIRAGYAKPDQIEECLDLQRRTSNGPLDWLISDPQVQCGQLVEALAAYAKHLEGALTNLRQGVERVSVPTKP